MAKLLLVEDDNNLREIYEARLTAEGYDIVTAQNGEEALVVAKQHHPDLIISDVMMPRISGFEMLDILRNTDELRDTKVIMLTALGQAEDQSRAGKLGADKYLVKSQVTLEDIVNSAKELLEGKSAAAEAPTEAVAAPAVVAAVETAPAAEPTPAPAPLPEPEPIPSPAPAPENAEPVTVASEVPAPQETTPAPTPQPATVTEQPSEPVQPVAVAVPEPVADVAQTVVTVPDPDPINPVDDTVQPIAAPDPTTTTVDDTAQTTATETTAVDAQIASFAEAPIAPAPVAAAGETPVTTEVAAANDQTLNQAMDELTTAAAEEAVETPVPPSEKVVPGTESSTTPVEVVSPEPASLVTPEPVAEAPAPAPEATVDAPAATEPSTTEEDNDHVNVAGKKVIQPINDVAAGPNLDELLAKEAAKEEGSAQPTPVVMGAEAKTPAPATQPGFDPNSIAL